MHPPMDTASGQKGEKMVEYKITIHGLTDKPVPVELREQIEEGIEMFIDTILGEEFDMFTQFTDRAERREDD